MNLTNPSVYRMTTRLLYLTILRFLGYSTTFLLSMLGNIMVIFVIFRHCKLRTVTNLCLANLAIADLGTTMAAIPFDLAVQENDNIWPYGKLLCKALYPLQTMFSIVGALTLITICCERYHALVHPLKYIPSLKKTSKVISSLWLIGVLSVSPYGCQLQLSERGKNTFYCEEQWPSIHLRQVYTLFMFLIQYLLPLSLMTPMYYKIVQSLRRAVIRTNTMQRSGYERRRLKQNQRTLKLLIRVVVLFSLLMFPTHFMWLWHDFGSGSEFSHFNEILAICNIVTFFHACVNPILYGVLSLDFRRSYRRALRDGGVYIRQCVDCRGNYFQTRNDREVPNVTKGQRTSSHFRSNKKSRKQSDEVSVSSEVNPGCFRYRTGTKGTDRVSFSRRASVLSFGSLSEISKDQNKHELLTLKSRNKNVPNTTDALEENTDIQIAIISG